jgi:gamma-glutamyl:cysteine ligase YbdK (ATP-grasp superfamily)
MVDILIILSLCSIPLSAILGSIYLKSKKLELQTEMNRQVAEALEENRELRTRVENLESLVGGINLDLLTSGNLSDSDMVRQQLQEMKARNQGRFRLQ